MTRFAGVLVLLVGATALCGGCGAPLPTYPRAGHREVVATMAERSAAIRSLRSPASLVLTSVDGSSVTLEAAVLAEPPERVRLRAWKLGHAVFDLTLNDGGVWLKAEDRGGDWGGGTEGRQGGLGRVTPEAVARAWRVFMGEPLEGGAVETSGTSDEVLVIRRDLADDGGGELIAEVDVVTRTPRRYRFVGPDGAARATLTLGRYRLVGGVALPTRIAAQSGDGSFVMTLTDPEVNTELPASAFRPPVGAVRQP